jgi:hypothetical protein
MCSRSRQIPTCSLHSAPSWHGVACPTSISIHHKTHCSIGAQLDCLGPSSSPAHYCQAQYAIYLMVTDLLSIGAAHQARIAAKSCEIMRSQLSTPSIYTWGDYLPSQTNRSVVGLVTSLQAVLQWTRE